MIIVCNSCPAQYSVPDARVRGKLVRITCKHCAAPIVFDGRQMLEEAVPTAMPAPAIASPESSHLREDDVTLIARPKASAFSVHDEATVIGQIPAEALAVERMLSQRTLPPPAGTPLPSAPSFPPSTISEPPASPPASPRSLPEMPERAIDETKSASPQAFSRSEPPAAPTAPVAPAAPKKPLPRDDRTLVSGSLESPIPVATPAVTPSRLRFALLAVVVVALGALWIATRTLR